jgi:hypothetical protein
MEIEAGSESHAVPSLCEVMVFRKTKFAIRKILVPRLNAQSPVIAEGLVKGGFSGQLSIRGSGIGTVCQLPDAGKTKVWAAGQPRTEAA